MLEGIINGNKLKPAVQMMPATAMELLKKAKTALCLYVNKIVNNNVTMLKIGAINVIGYSW